MMTFPPWRQNEPSGNKSDWQQENLRMISKSLICFCVFVKICIYLFLFICLLGLSCGHGIFSGSIRTPSCSMLDLVPWPDRARAQSHCIGGRVLATGPPRIHLCVSNQIQKSQPCITSTFKVPCPSPFHHIFFRTRWVLIPENPASVSSEPKDKSKWNIP